MKIVERMKINKRKKRKNEEETKQTLKYCDATLIFSVRVINLLALRASWNCILNRATKIELLSSNP